MNKATHSYYERILVVLAGYYPTFDTGHTIPRPLCVAMQFAKQTRRIHKKQIEIATQTTKTVDQMQASHLRRFPSPLRGWIPHRIFNRDDSNEKAHGFLKHRIVLHAPDSGGSKPSENSSAERTIREMRACSHIEHGNLNNNHVVVAYTHIFRCRCLSKQSKAVARGRDASVAVAVF